VATDDPTGSEELRSAREAKRAERRAARQERAALVTEPTGEVTRGGPVQFLRECLAELRRVNWPDREALQNATAVVLIATIVVGIYLYALDSVFTQAARWLIDQQAG
jgi:preprotein translocase subunit SecE